jgi:hypothetical protein
VIFSLASLMDTASGINGQQQQSDHHRWQGGQVDYRIPGVGVLTATAAVATVTDAKSFKSGREFAAWIGLVPKQTEAEPMPENDEKLGVRVSHDLMLHNARLPRNVGTGSGIPKATWICPIRQRATGELALSCFVPIRCRAFQIRARPGSRFFLADRPTRHILADTSWPPLFRSGLDHWEK